MDLAVVKNLRCSLTLHFAVIACLTAMLVATGTGSYFLPIFILFVSTAAYIFVDRLEWFELGRIGSYVGMLAVTAFSIASYLYSAFSTSSESGQLLAIAGLLVYPEAVLFLQRKNLRVYEQMAVFLLLEMIVAALVNDNIMFGILLAPIMLLWVSSLFLFSRYATLMQIDASLEQPIPILAEILYRRFIKSVIGENQPAAVVTTRTSLADIQASHSLRRTLQSIPLGLGAIAFAGFFFYLIPRTTPANFEPSLGTQARVGLPKTLNVGTVGRLLSDPTPVMRVSFSRLINGQQYALREPPYIRARVLDTYGGYERSDWFRRGEWVFGGIHQYLRLKGLKARRVPSDPPRDLVKVEFDIKPQFAETVFAIPPAFAVDNSAPVPLNFDDFNMVLEEIDSSKVPSGKSLVYRVGSAGFAARRQLRVMPADWGDNTFATRRNIANLSVNFQRFARCDAYRQELLNSVHVPLDRPYAVASAIERHFTDGDFTYTLDLRPPIDPDLDPIEDFLINQRRGHCQYFASAMLLMLRQSNIPSRLVIGYRPLEFNQLGGYWVVKQSDAHAWVEALLTAEELSDSELQGWAQPGRSYWVRFDPTPEQDGESMIAQQGQVIDYAEKLWKDYVVEGQKLSSDNSLYAPVAANSQNAYQQFMENVRSIRQGVETGDWTFGLGRIGFAWRISILIIVLGCLSILLWQSLVFIKRMSPRIARRLGLRLNGHGIKQPFFARCVELLAKRGLQRQPHETPAEFTRRASLFFERTLAPKVSSAGASDQARGELERLESSGNAHLRNTLQRLTSFYYRLRFSHDAQLAPVEQQEIEQALDQLANATSRRGKKN